MTVQPEKLLTSKHCLRSLRQRHHFAGVVHGAGRLCHHGVTPPARSPTAGWAAWPPLDPATVLGPAGDEKLLAKGSPSCTCNIAVVPGTMLMDWREFRGEPGT